jgi:hypothetical protein
MGLNLSCKLANNNYLQTRMGQAVKACLVVIKVCRTAYRAGSQLPSAQKLYISL